MAYFTRIHEKLPKKIKAIWMDAVKSFVVLGKYVLDGSIKGIDVFRIIESIISKQHREKLGNPGQSK